MIEHESVMLTLSNYINFDFSPAKAINSHFKNPTEIGLVLDVKKKPDISLPIYVTHFIFQ